MKRIASFFTAVALAGLPVMAQTDMGKVETDTTISRDIEVVKEYNPVIREAGKVNTMPELRDVDTKKIKTNYSIWTLPTTPVSEVIPTLDYAEASTPVPQDVHEGFVRVGGGNYTSFLGEVYTPLYKDGSYLIDFYGKHNSSFGDIELTKDMYPSLYRNLESDALFNDNKAKVAFLKGIRNSEFSAFVDFGYNRFNYYGYDSFKDSLANNAKLNLSDDYKEQAFMNFNVNARYRAKDFVGKWKYDVQTNYQLFHNRNSLSEHTIYTNFQGVYRMETSMLGLNVDMYNIFMSRPDSSEFFRYGASDNLHSYTVLKLNPKYTFEGKSGMMQIGVIGTFCMGQGRPGSVMPDIYGHVQVIDKKWYVYAGVSGDFVVNSYRNVTMNNRYVSPDVRVEDTYVPIDIYAGTKIKFFNQLAVDLNIGYRVVNNPYFFVNRRTVDTVVASAYHNIYDVVYCEDAGLFNAGLGIKYKWRDKADFAVKMKVNKWSLEKDETPWMQPKFELSATSSYLPTDYLRFNIAYHLATGREALVHGSSLEMNDVHDLSIGANYKVLSFADIFLNLNNILCQEYESWYGYTSQGFNIMGGISIVF